MSKKNIQPYYVYDVVANKHMGAQSDSMGPPEFTTAASGAGSEMGLKPVFDLNELPVSVEDEEEAFAAKIPPYIYQPTNMSDKNTQPYYDVAVIKHTGAQSDSMGPSEMGLKHPLVLDLNELPVSVEGEEEVPAAKVAVEEAGGSASSGKRKIPEGESGFKQQVKRVKDFVGKWLFKKEFPGDQE